MEIIRKIIRKNEIAAYVITTFIITWIIWGILFFISDGIIRGLYNINLTLLFTLGGFCPSIVSIIFTGILYGINGIKKLLLKLTIWKVNPLWYLFVLLFLFMIAFYIPVLICNLLGSNYHITVKVYLYYILLYSFFINLITGGPLGEELGWRGFILPRLQKKFSPLVSGIILGIIWASWHLPLFYIPIAPQYKGSFLMFLLNDLLLTINFVWVFNNTKGSLLLACLFHASWNFTNSSFRIRPSAFDNVYFTIAFQSLFLIITIIAAVSLKNNKNKKITIDEYISE